MRMITKVPHNYANVDLVKGDEFECEEKDVELIKCLGRAEPAEATEQPRRKYQKRAA